MHIDSSSRTSANGQVYTRHLLRTSFREDGKVKKSTIANLSHCTEHEIKAMKLALKHKSNLNDLGTLTDDVSIQQGSSFGATYVLNEVAKRIGISDALGNTQEGKLALWQVIARTMDQGVQTLICSAGSASQCCINTEHKRIQRGSSISEPRLYFRSSK